jgi:serine/threonine-protein kinase
MIQPKANVHQVSRYVLLRQLGQGHSTRVFLAAPRSAAPAIEPCVLELLDPERARDENFRALFLDQAAATLSLRHPRLVRTDEVVADAEACGVATEFLHGQTLARVLERIGRLRFPVDMHLHILSHVLDALSFAHHFTGPGQRLGFVHRDVCPSNVFITYDGRVKLLGIGFANVTRELETRLGEPLADVRYAAPEVLLKYPAGAGADVFGVGVMLWEAVTRQARSPARDLPTLIQKRTRGEETDLEDVWPDAPTPLVDMCRRALAANPRERYASAQALREALDAYLARWAEPSDVVLGRLPQLLERHFHSERTELERTISTSLADARAVPAPPRRLLLEEQEETPHDASHDEETSAELSRPSIAAFASVAAPEREASAPPAAPPRRDSDTGGHRAYSSTWNGPAPAGLPASPLGIRKTVLLPAIVIVVGLFAGGRLIIGRARPAPGPADVAHAATALAARPAASATTPPLRAAAARVAPPARAAASTSPQPIPAAPAPRDVANAGPRPPRALAEAPAAEPTAPDAGAPDPESGSVSSAFFDGTTLAAPTLPEGTRPLSADELPSIDDARDSLQRAILSAARARRAAARQRAKKHAPEPPAPVLPGAVLPRPIDDADPYAEPPVTQP